MLICLTTVFLSCNSNKTKEKTTGVETKTTTPESATATTSPSPAPSPLEKFLGSFVGAFGDNKITMLITKVEGDSVVGRTIVGGNDRPFRGTFKKEGTYLAFNAKEPGDHKDDGEFNFKIDEASPDTVSGEWKPFAKGRPAKQYQLERKTFTYRPDVGDYPEASQRLLKASDVENLMKEDLEFMRNEIFARHGYCFNKKNLRQQFELQDWYVPNTVNIKGFLTETEKKNIALIKRYEKYAEEYGDEYGR
jgi:hypothetical protein